MASSSKITILAVLIAYAVFCFSVPPSTSATPNVRGGIPSLYMKAVVRETLGVRCAIVAVAPTGLHEVGQAGPQGEIDVLDQLESLVVGMMVVADRVLLSLAAFLSIIAIALKWPMRVAAAASSILMIYTMFTFGIDEVSCGRAVLEVLAVFVSMIALALRIPQSRSPTFTTILGPAILIAYAVFSFSIPPSMSETPHVRGGIPSLYMQPALRHVRGLRGNAVAETMNEVPKLEQEVASSCMYAFVEVLAVSISIMAVARRMPQQSRSPARMTITGSAVLVAYALFSFSMPLAMNVTPHVRGAIPSLYVQPVCSANSGLRAAAVPSTPSGMNEAEVDQVHYEAYEAFSEITDVLSESYGPIGYWAALSVPAMSMAYLTQRKVHSKLH